MRDEQRQRLLGMAALAAFGTALSAGLSAATLPPVTAGIIVDIKGKPAITRAVNGKTGTLKMQDFVCERDTIKTGPGERVALTFVGGAEMRINESSEFTVESGGGVKPTSVYTKAGQAWTRMLHGRAGMNVRSPLAVASVRGTEADVEVEKRMTVKVYEGLVDVQNQFGKQSLKAGMMTQVAGVGQAPGQAKTMAPGDYGNWQSTLTPKDLEDNLKKLNTAATNNRSINLKFKGKDGKEKSVDIQIQKKK